MLLTVKDHIRQGFQWGAREGPLCDERKAPDSRLISCYAQTLSRSDAWCQIPLTRCEPGTGTNLPRRRPDRSHSTTCVLLILPNGAFSAPRASIPLLKTNRQLHGSWSHTTTSRCRHQPTAYQQCTLSSRVVVGTSRIISRNPGRRCIPSRRSFLSSTQMGLRPTCERRRRDKPFACRCLIIGR